ncbi:antiviral reverse transcriptase Drt3b [Pseudomonas aeruginosa]|uniref:antiviral reverse transcriptase Drt3b n=1 Tax=Pseudomonas aeruginosa TaxID=287 RepID=UPI00071C079F|nr:antiviral reverse transcriptase Drt3b [Pseudomonas aeruginosa]KSQ03250.1 reverse transcriptase [Pseudomonas aeruginosa]RPW53974.1 reverse transcriptase [Pseudomonas aeruginosa]
MAKKALSINFPIERAILSDVLPFEVPIVFSNRHLYKFLCDNKVKYHDNSFEWQSQDEALDKLVKLLIGVPTDKETQHTEKDGKKTSQIILNKQDRNSSIPFTFSISHKEDQSRHLSLIHPSGQLLVVDFYDEHKDLITYHSAKSNYSLRAPKRTAGCTYIDSRALIEKKETIDSVVELEGDNYENLKSFFVYERFSNIFKFYESKEHLEGEREFRNLAKLDVSSCFDRIYTHSIAWAIYKKEYAKNNLNLLGKTFPGRFDKLMQKINYNETNGIVIGPEVSRIFAEIIFQAIDVDTQRKLEKRGHINGKHYRIYRYVDDYFVFYNDETIYSDIKLSLQDALKLYKLSLNKNKEEIISRPIITPISIAKKRISDLFNEKLSYELERFEENEIELFKGSIYINQLNLITDFKSILSTSSVEYKDVLNYSLSILDKKVSRIIFDFNKLDPRHASFKQFSSAIESIIGFSFFIFSVSPKVNTTIKLCRIIQRIITFINTHAVGKEYCASIFRQIFDYCCSILEQTINPKSTSIETLYLLVLMRQLGRSYWLDEKNLGRYFNITDENGIAKFKNELDYFSITTLLFYISDKVRYKKLKKLLISHIQDKFESRRNNLIGDSEMLHLALDILSCPFIENDLKRWVLSLYGIPKQHFRRISSYNDFWFTKWKDFDFSRELDAKVSQEVY